MEESDPEKYNAAQLPRTYGMRRTGNAASQMPNPSAQCDHDHTLGTAVCSVRDFQPVC